MVPPLLQCVGSEVIPVVAGITSALLRSVQMGIGTKVHHPLFACLYARVSGKAEARGQAEHRQALLKGLSGRVIVLCTVPDQDAAVAELFRVIKPGGELRFYEHVLANGRRLARFQRIADATFWARVSGGCHLSRDTPAAFARAGFVVDSCRRFPFTPMPFPPKIPHILGVARRPEPA